MAAVKPKTDTATERKVETKRYAERTELHEGAEREKRQSIDEIRAGMTEDEKEAERRSKEREQYGIEAARASYESDVDPASMVVSPQSKPKIESETKEVGGPGDPRIIAANAVDTPDYGTETPWRDTPPTNVSSIHETNSDQSPPTDPDASQEDCDAMLESEVPPEVPEGEVLSTIETRSAVEVFPAEYDSDMEPPRPRNTQSEQEQRAALGNADPRRAARGEPLPATERRTER